MKITRVRLPLSPDTSEDDFQARVIREAKDAGWLYFHVFDARRSVAGFPDLVMVRAGVLLVAELKVKRNKPTAAQGRWLAAFGEVPGVKVYHWRPEHWPEILTTLRADDA